MNPSAAAAARSCRSNAANSAHSGRASRAASAEDEPPRFSAVSTTTAVLDGAARLCAVHRLRAHDAVQLSCPLTAREALPECAECTAFDRQLRAAAAAEGFSLVPASLEA